MLNLINDRARSRSLARSPGHVRKRDTLPTHSRVRSPFAQSDSVGEVRYRARLALVRNLRLLGWPGIILLLLLILRFALNRRISDVESTWGYATSLPLIPVRMFLCLTHALRLRMSLL